MLMLIAKYGQYIKDFNVRDILFIAPKFEPPRGPVCRGCIHIRMLARARARVCVCVCVCVCVRVHNVP